MCERFFLKQLRDIPKLRDYLKISAIQFPHHSSSISKTKSGSNRRMFSQKAPVHMPEPSLSSVMVLQYPLGAHGKPNGQALSPMSHLFYMLEIGGESLLEKIEFCCFRIAALGEQCPLLKKTFPPLLSKSLPFSKAGPTNEGSKHDSRPTWTECGPLGYRRGYTSHLYRSCAASGTSAIRTNIFNSHVHRITAIFFFASQHF